MVQELCGGGAEGLPLIPQTDLRWAASTSPRSRRGCRRSRALALTPVATCSFLHAPLRPYVPNRLQNRLLVPLLAVRRLGGDEVNDHHPQSVHVHRACPLRVKQGLAREVAHVAIVARSRVEAVLERVALAAEPSVPAEADKPIASDEEDVVTSRIENDDSMH